MEQKLRMKDVVDEFNTISNFVKRNIHSGENNYYEFLFSFAKNKNNMGEESLTDEEIIKFWPETFGNGITKENREELYNELHSDYDNYEFQDREYDGKIYTDYDDFRMGDWDVEEFWRTTDYNGLLPDSSIGFLPDSSDEEEEEYAMYPYISDEEDECDVEYCMCSYCKRFRSERYDPPITRLQKRKQQSLITATKQLIESYKELGYYWYEYMEEQKQYDEYEVEQKLGEHDLYVTEDDYIFKCNKIKDRFEDETDSLKLYNTIRFIQYLMKDYAFNKFMKPYKEEYEKNKEQIDFLQRDIHLLKTVVV